MAKVRRATATQDPNALKFVDKIFKVHTRDAQTMNGWLPSLRIEMKKIRGVIKRPVIAMVTLRYEKHIGWKHEYWKNFEDVSRVDLSFHGSYGKAAMIKAIEKMGLNGLNFVKSQSSLSSQITLDNVENFEEYFRVMKKAFLDDEILAAKYPKGWKDHGPKHLPLKVYHRVNAIELTQKILEITGVKLKRVKLGFRFDSANSTLGVQIRSMKTNGVNTEILELMHTIDEEVKKHRTANDSLHQSGEGQD